jgi:hypothetical protein
MWERRSVETMYRPRDSESCRRWFLAATFTRSQGADQLFQFPIEEPMVFAPADEVGGDPAGDFRLLAAPERTRNRW